MYSYFATIPQKSPHNTPTKLKKAIEGETSQATEIEMTLKNIKGIMNGV